MPSLLVKVKAKMAIHAHEKVRGVLEGEYGSVFKGRSMDFDDLREYVVGDDIKDIDWKATARSGSTLIRRYIAIRKHNIMLVVDTGRDMAATAVSGDNKKDVAVMAAGVVGYIALKHGDLVGLVAGDSARTQYFPLKGSNPHLERLLQHVNSSTTLQSAPSNLLIQLEYIARTMRRRMMLIVISDDIELTDQYEQVLRRLRAQHEVMWLSIGDASGLDASHEFHDIDDIALLPHFVRADKKLKKAYESNETQQLSDNQRRLERLGIVGQRIVGDSDVVSGLFRLLERQKHARRR